MPVADPQTNLFGLRSRRKRFVDMLYEEVFLVTFLNKKKLQSESCQALRAKLRLTFWLHIVAMDGERIQMYIREQTLCCLPLAGARNFALSALRSRDSRANIHYRKLNIGTRFGPIKSGRLLTILARTVIRIHGEFLSTFN